MRAAGNFGSGIGKLVAVTTSPLSEKAGGDILSGRLVSNPTLLKARGSLRWCTALRSSEKIHELCGMILLR